MDDYESLSHSVWDCKYHVVFIPKCRKKTLYGELRQRLGDVFRTLAKQKECQVVEGHLMPDHVHMLISIPPKYSVVQVIGYIKGKSAIHVARTFFDHKAERLPGASPTRAAARSHSDGEARFRQTGGWTEPLVALAGPPLWAIGGVGPLPRRPRG